MEKRFLIKTMPTMLSLIIIFVSLPIFPITALTSGKCGDDISWYIAGNQTLIISGKGDMYNYTSDTMPWYSYRNSLGGVEIRNGVTSIGNYAFSGFNKITSITIHDTVTKIGNYAFSNCSYLSGINLPNSIESIGECAFYYCSFLMEINLPINLLSIGRSAFFGCTSLKNVEIPKNVSYIGNAAFNYCTSIEKLTVSPYNFKYHSFSNSIIETSEKKLIIGCADTVIPEDGSVTSIGDYAFIACVSMKRMIIPFSVLSIGKWAFSDCTSLETISIPSGITEIKENTFNGCRSLLNLDIPDTVTTIEKYAFLNCSSIENISFNGSGYTFQDIGYYAFGGCDNLENIYFQGFNYQWNFSVGEGNSSFNYANHIYSNGYEGGFIYYLNLTDNTAAITGLESPMYGDVVIPDTICGFPVTSIDSGAFSYYRYCTASLSEACEEEVEAVNAYFSGGGAFISEDINESLGNPFYKSIANGEAPFYSELTSVLLPNSIISIGDNNFDNYINLKYNEYGNALYLGNGENPYLALIKAYHNATFCVMNKATKTVANSAFKCCTMLSVVDMPKSVTYIGNSAFLGCTNLEKVYYLGTDKEKSKITIGFDNDLLADILWYCNCSSEHLKTLEKIEQKGETLKNKYLKTAIQKEKGANAGDSIYRLRLISMLDCLEDYKEVGFFITISGYNDGENDEAIKYSTDMVYTSFINGEKKVYASDYGAEYFTICYIEIPNKYYSSTITIKPYIVFTDGTEFEGSEFKTAVSEYIK